jgi:hypothetical protein
MRGIGRGVASADDSNQRAQPSIREPWRRSHTFDAPNSSIERRVVRFAKGGAPHNGKLSLLLFATVWMVLNRSELTR